MRLSRVKMAGGNKLAFYDEAGFMLLEDAAKNAGILAAQIIGSSNAEVLQRIVDFKEQLKVKVMESVEEMKKNK